MNATSLPHFLVEVAGYGHGPMHVNLGGVFGACTGAMTKLYQDHAEEMKKVCPKCAMPFLPPIPKKKQDTAPPLPPVDCPSF